MDDRDEAVINDAIIAGIDWLGRMLGDQSIVERDQAFMDPGVQYVRVTAKYGDLLPIKLADVAAVMNEVPDDKDRDVMPGLYVKAHMNEVVRSMIAQLRTYADEIEKRFGSDAK